MRPPKKHCSVSSYHLGDTVSVTLVSEHSHDARRHGGSYGELGNILFLVFYHPFSWLRIWIINLSPCICRTRGLLVGVGTSFD